MSTVRGFIPDRSGQALVEFALVMPLLVGLLVAIIEIGGAWRATHVLTHAAREGARRAVVPGSTNQQVTERIQGALSLGGLDPARAELVLAIRDGTGSTDTVTVRYAYGMPFLGAVTRLLGSSAADAPPGSVQLASTTVMRNE